MRSPGELQLNSSPPRSKQPPAYTALAPHLLQRVGNLSLHKSRCFAGPSSEHDVPLPGARGHLRVTQRPWQFASIQIWGLTMDQESSAAPTFSIHPSFLGSLSYR